MLIVITIALLDLTEGGSIEQSLGSGADAFSCNTKKAANALGSLKPSLQNEPFCPSDVR